MSDFMSAFHSVKTGIAVSLTTSGGGAAGIMGFVATELLGTLSLIVGILVGITTIVSHIDKRRSEKESAIIRNTLDEMQIEESRMQAEEARLNAEESRLRAILLQRRISSINATGDPE